MLRTSKRDILEKTKLDWSTFKESHKRNVLCCVIFTQNNFESFTSRITEYWLSIAASILPVKQTKILKRWWRFTPGHPPKIKLVPFFSESVYAFQWFF